MYHSPQTVFLHNIMNCNAMFLTFPMHWKVKFQMINTIQLPRAWILVVLLSDYTVCDDGEAAQLFIKPYITSIIDYVLHLVDATGFSHRLDMYSFIAKGREILSQ